MKPSLTFEQDPAGPRVPGRRAREAGDNPEARTRVVAQLSEAQRAQLFSFAAEHHLSAGDVIRRALGAMGVISE